MPAKPKLQIAKHEASPARKQALDEPRKPASHKEIQRRAYFVYLDRGASDGWDVEDWLQAEYELNKKG